MRHVSQDCFRWLPSICLFRRQTHFIAVSSRTIHLYQAPLVSPDRVTRSNMDPPTGSVQRSFGEMKLNGHSENVISHVDSSEQDNRIRAEETSAENEADDDSDGESGSGGDESDGADLSADDAAGNESGYEAERDSQAANSESGSDVPEEHKDFPPLELNYEALRHIATYYLPGNHGKCTDIETLNHGGFHEIRLLKFEDGWSCIGRFARDRDEHLCIGESEYATVSYVRQHTSIPVPEIYFINFDPTHAVGAPFVLMERLIGEDLYFIWDDLTLYHKLAAMEQVVDVLVQLMSLKFDKIGSLHQNGEVGSYVSWSYGKPGSVHGPFGSTKEWMLSFLETHRSPEIMAHHPGIRSSISQFLDGQAESSFLHAPYRLIHGDFDAQNMLFAKPEDGTPKLTGMIDWDWSYTGPLYYLLEYPIFIRDNDCDRKEYTNNKVLRKRFVQSLAQRFPKGSNERREVKEVFRQKSFLMNSFRNIWVAGTIELPYDALGSVATYERCISGVELDPLDPDDDCNAYGGRGDWEPDSELESDDEDLGDVHRRDQAAAAALAGGWVRQ